jgi:hypothetical protein
VTMMISNGETTDPSQIVIPPVADHETKQFGAVTPPPDLPPPDDESSGETVETNQQDPQRRRDPVVGRLPSNPPGIQFASEAGLATVLERLNEQVMADDPPAGAQLVAVRDTLVAAHTQASTDDHKRTAARLLAFVESLRGDADACRTWVAEVGRLGSDVSRLQAMCSSERP